MLIWHPVYLVCRFLCWVILAGWCGFRVEGREHIPRHGPFIVAANHVSYLDPPAVGAAFQRHLRFIAKDELFRMPVLGPLIAWLEAISITLSQPAVNMAVIKTAVQCLQRGEIVAIFPEGRRNTSGHIEPAKLGTALIALRAGAPILPVVVIGTEKALPPGARMIRRERVVVRIGPPIPVERGPRLAGRLALEQLADCLTRALIQLNDGK